MSQVSETFTYPEVGATRGDLPAGYTINHTQSELGNGIAVFEAACQALRDWEQLRLGWVDVWPGNSPMREGEQIAVLGRAFGAFWLNACRIAYVIDEGGSCPRFGYAHGTLPAHLAIGEERFLIEMDAAEVVSLDILAFSRPNTLLARLGYPVMKREQRRFGRQSALHFSRVVSSAVEAAQLPDASLKLQQVG